MSKELERLEQERQRLISELDGNDNVFDRQYFKLAIKNIDLQIQVYNLMQPAVQKRMLASPKILVIQNDKTIGEIESELLEKSKKYDQIMSADSSEVMKAIERMLTYKIAGIQEENKERFSQQNINDYTKVKNYILKAQNIEEKANILRVAFENIEKEFNELKKNILKEIERWEEFCLDDPLNNAFVCTNKIKALCEGSE